MRFSVSASDDPSDNPLAGFIDGLQAVADTGLRVQLPTTAATAKSPASEFAKLDFSSLEMAVEAFPADVLARISSKLGKTNPATLTGMSKFFYEGGVKLGLLALPSVVGAAALALLIPDVGIFFAAFLLLITFIAIGIGSHFMVRDVAKPFELRTQWFGDTNNVQLITEEETSASHIAPLARFPRGDRRQWVSDRIVIPESETCGYSLELGVYCYERRSKDKDGKVSYRTQSIDYGYLPLPKDVKISHWFEIESKAIFGSSDVPLSSSFDRTYGINLQEKSDEARLLVTRAIAPDVQQQLLDLADRDKVELQFTPTGIVMRSRNLTVSDFSRRQEVDSDRRISTVLSSFTALFHEIFEQLNPIYKQLKS